MKKLLILLFSLLISFNSYGGLFDKTVCVGTDAQFKDGLIYLPNKTKPFSGKNLCKYKNGQNASKGKVKDGMKNGVWTKWNENGQIEFESTFKDNQITIEKNYIGAKLNITTHYKYNENGEVESSEYYEEGKLVGETKYFYDDGEYIGEENYKDGKLSKVVSLNPFINDNRTLEIEFKDGKMVTQIVFHENGKRNRITNYGEDGKTIILDKTWNENGQITSELVNNKEYQDDEGVYEIRYDYYKNGQIKEIFGLNYHLDKHGRYDAWYENGQKKWEGRFADGNLVGKWTGWNENGLVRCESMYRGGVSVSGNCD
jgi:uncharacterized protein